MHDFFLFFDWMQTSQPGTPKAQCAVGISQDSLLQVCKMIFKAKLILGNSLF